MKKVFSISIMMTLLMSSLLVSCSPEDPTGGVEKPDNVVTNLATDVTPFSVTLNGAINNFKVTEISRGQYGFLYILSDEMDENAAKVLFDEYVANGSADGCKKRYAVNLSTDKTFLFKINDLQPSSNIYYCALFENEDGEIFIGNVMNVKSLEFAPKLRSTEVVDLRLLHTVVSLDVDLCGASSKESMLGLRYSTNEEDLITDKAIDLQYKKQLTGNIFEIDITPLKANTTYYVRPYVYFKQTKEYTYGDVVSFTTLNPEILEVDMGLSVKWSSCDLGADDPFQDAWYFTFLSLTPIKFDSSLYGDGYYDSYMSNEEFNDLCPEDIAGTEFDPATYYLGGKWRMPTLAEVQELMNNTVVELKQKDDFDELELEHSVVWSKKMKDAHFKMNSYKTMVSSDNLMVRTANRWWISTTSEYGEDYSWHRLPYLMRVYDEIYYVETAPYLECSIRPVCDY